MSQSAEDLQMEALWNWVLTDVVPTVIKVKVQIVYPDFGNRHRSLIVTLENSDCAVTMTRMRQELVTESKQTGRPASRPLTYYGHQPAEYQLQFV